MGVPAFFRWLSRKYPSIVVHCIEQKCQEINEMKIPVDATQPNPNEVEFDNLYLDMNGIIHPCCHPEDKQAPEDEDEMMLAIFEYIDRIFNIVRPRRLLYMAIDGVAPRAKMNQQRSRRFRAAKESREKREDITRIREELESRGVELPPKKPDHAHFDSNCITPGTEFMANLAESLQYFVHDRMNSNPAWQGIKVILSDANVPGEGEHKVMDYIRQQRGQPNHDPNTHHCLYGADADLIMLGLATHEPHFTILREEFKPNQPRPCEICGQVGHDMKECTGAEKTMEGEFDQFANSSTSLEKQFIFLRLCVLREYLERELRIDGLPFPFDLDRAIDDWVFMCFFVGNDFLPHLPSLEIREGAIDRLIRLYKSVVPQTHGYLTHNGTVNLHRVQMMMTELGKVEDEIFRNRRERDLQFKQKAKMRKEAAKRRRSMYDNPAFTPEGQFAPAPLSATPSPITNPRQEAFQMRQFSMATTTTDDNKSAAASLRAQLRGGPSSKPPQSDTSSSTPKSEMSSSTPLRSASSPSSANGSITEVTGPRKRKRENDSDSEPEDDVRLWEDGWKERYYNNKFGVPADDEEFVGAVSTAYTEGLCWVLAYYYQGCSSWKWFYPYHYAPFASDFKDITKVRNTFPKGQDKPFRPLEQLMGVFPAASGNFIPEAFRSLMSEEHSTIIDFYPKDFKVDLNGKKYMWQGVALLPFVDEIRLLRALKDYYHTLTPEEERRNSLGCNRLFVHRQNRLFPFLRTLYESISDSTRNQAVEINPEHTQGMRGTVLLDDYMEKVLSNRNKVTSPLASLPEFETFAIGVKFQDPSYPLDHVYQAVLLPGVRPPERVLRPGGRNFQGPPGSYRPQTGFSPRGPNFRNPRGGTPGPAHRMLRNAMSDPRDRRQQPSGGHPPYYPQSHRDSYQGPPSIANWQPLPPPPSHQYPPRGPPRGPPHHHPRHPPPPSRDDYYYPTAPHSYSRSSNYNRY